LIKIVTLINQLVKPVELTIRLSLEELLLPNVMSQKAFYSCSFIDLVLEYFSYWGVNLDEQGLSRYHAVNFCEARRPINEGLNCRV